MSRVVLDAEAFNALAGPTSTRRTQLRQMIVAAERTGSDVVVPTVVLAELYRPGRLSMVDACLARSSGVPSCRDTDRGLARTVGGVLAGARAGSEHLADAHVVATAVEAGRAIVVTGDPDDITRLAGPYPTVNVVALD